jgi:hypothetical protein
MSNRYNNGVMNRPGETVTRETSPRFASGPVEVNVIFTDQASTAGALAFAQTLARDLGASIHLQAAVAVPFQLPLDQPAVSVSFLQEQLRKVLSELERDGFEPTAHLYLCRDRVRALHQALKPDSLIVIGGQKRWWPTREGRIADALRTNGHRVIFVDSKARLGSERAMVAR